MNSTVSIVYIVVWSEDCTTILATVLFTFFFNSRQILCICTFSKGPKFVQLVLPLCFAHCYSVSNANGVSFEMLSL